MKQVLKQFAVLLLISSTVFAQTSATATASSAPPARKSAKAKRTAAPAYATQQDLQMLRDTLAQQQQLLQQMQQQMQQRDQQLAEAQAAVREAQSKAAAAETAATEQKDTTGKLAADVSDLKLNATNTATSLQETQKDLTEKINTPSSLHYKGITLTPGGFIAAEGLWRQRTEQTDVISSFNGIPFGGPQSHLTEFRGSARQSRLALLAEGKVGSVKLTGYWEADFLGAAPTANENQSTSFNPRQRQLFAQAALDSGWTFTAGQTWSLITLNKKSIEARGEWVPATIDGQYVVGYNFARLMTARVAKTFADKKATVAFSVENPATLLGGINTPSYVVVALPGTGALGNGANYSVNLAPDVIGKISFDPGWGHYEIKGVGRFFRDRIVPNGTTIPAGSNKTEIGGGIGFGAILPVVAKKVDVIAQGLYGTGVARYTDSSNVDVIVRPDGSLSTVKSYSALFGVETHPTPKLDWYIYGGGEYLDRNSGSMLDLTGTLKQFGYGNPTNNVAGCFAAESTFACPANFKQIVQGSTGFWYRFYKGSYGTLQYGAQYSYTHKGTWAGLNGTTPASPRANESIVMTSFRYYIP